MDSFPQRLRKELRDRLSIAGQTGLWIAPEQAVGVGDAKGAYLLALHLANPLRVKLPNTAAAVLEPGWYLYAGSAWGGGGIAARVKRHFRGDKKAHWHIDRLTLKANDMAALTLPGGNECDLVELLLRAPCFRFAFKGFGSSDCRRCKSHLLKFHE
ncbi:DUF123 domain-containing protein [Pelagibius sp. Alg239-R121]|uniref:GIY-YIG nuclease family protein n=1 Tax=Pelagibius sp. Alg239-R121 TaxID=2993448 RepID=UPI0024A6E033|nr:GIY-YIG nuclease family protein [Pelagibius sp. Alg239-R121]